MERNNIKKEKHILHILTKFFKQMPAISRNALQLSRIVSDNIQQYIAKCRKCKEFFDFAVLQFLFHILVYRSILVSDSAFPSVKKS